MECGDHVRLISIQPNITASGVLVELRTILIHALRCFTAWPSDRLTGLLSFMLSDEMTTGSVTTSDAEKRSYAARSHAWNVEQRRFKEAFPDVSSHPTATATVPGVLFYTVFSCPNSLDAVSNNNPFPFS